MRVVDDDQRCRGLLPLNAMPRRRAIRRRNGGGSSSSCFLGRRGGPEERPDDAHSRPPVEPRGRPPGAPQQTRAARAPHLPWPFPLRRRPPAGSGGRQGDHGRVAADLGWADPCALAPLPPHLVGRMMPPPSPI